MTSWSCLCSAVLGHPPPAAVPSGTAGIWDRFTIDHDRFAIDSQRCMIIRFTKVEDLMPRDIRSS